MTFQTRRNTRKLGESVICLSAVWFDLSSNSIISFSPISFPSGFGAQVEISPTAFGVSFEGDICPFNARRHRLHVWLRQFCCASSSSSHARCHYYSSRTMTALRCHSSEPLPSWHISCTFPSLTTARNRDRRPSLCIPPLCAWRREWIDSDNLPYVSTYSLNCIAKIKKRPLFWTPLILNSTLWIACTPLGGLFRWQL